MQTILLAAACAALSATAAVAADTMADRFGNTVISKGDGPEVHTYYNADGTFTGKVIGMKLSLKGTWKVDGDKLCLTYDPPPPTVKNPVCVPNDEHKIGDTWMTGKRTVTLVQGIQ
jgi:hypothetical protein